ncbi:MAG: hypothetical protein RBU21_13680 [FCB group bacterium]|nr:hypothetical protein [FCB group bacterium]
MSRRHWAFVLLAAGLALWPAGALAAKDEGDITVNLFVNYGSAFKDKTWAPVDVVVKNEREDVKGWIEVQTYSNDLLQSPVYRQPIELPKDSQKRVQFHCYLNGATRLVAQVYNGRRPMLPIPAEFAGLRPIPPEDLMCLVLDDEGAGFQFLYVVASANDSKRGIHRENLGTDSLPFLSDHPQAYEPFDLIVLGNFDPRQVGERQRELLYNYVRNGGVLAVCTGEFARKYRGTWVEDLLGAKVGPEEVMDEAALAKAVFAPEGQTDAHAGRQVAVAALEPQAPEVERIGTERLLGTKRPFGAGVVYGLAVDADSHALQDTPGYRNLWREISTARRGVGALNIDAVASYVAERLPQISGIVVHSKSSVILYLLVYFLVAIVGNWLVFSWLKRREWAWAALVVFAVGFTAYAMVYGTSGRARTSEMHQVQVLRVPQGGGVCAVDSLAGILTAHTDRYTMTIQHPYPLVEDMYYRNEWLNPQQRGLGFGGGTVRPFTLLQGDTPRIDNFSIGASELRMVRVRTDLELEGAVDGNLVLDNDALHGELVNRTGFPLDGMFIMFRGRRFEVRIEGDRILVHAPVALLRERMQRTPDAYPIQNGMMFDNRNMQGGDFWEVVPTILFTDLDPNTGLTLPRQTTTDVYLCGWSRTRHVPSVATNEKLVEKTNATLIVADVHVTYKDEGLGDLAFEDLRGWAFNRTDAMDRLRSEDIPKLQKAVQQLVQEAPADRLVSDLIGNFSQLTQRFGQHKPAAELAIEWGASDQEAAEAALWDRAIENWIVTWPEFRPEGVNSMQWPLSGLAQSLALDDTTAPAGAASGGVTIDPLQTLGFVRPDKLAFVEGRRPRIEEAGPNGDANLRNYFCYALTEIWSPNDRVAYLAHGSDDWSRIWINGNEVYSNFVGRDAEINQEIVQVPLKAGKNIVLIECGNEMGEWEFSLAFERYCEGLETRLPEWAPKTAAAQAAEAAGAARGRR